MRPDTATGLGICALFRDEAPYLAEWIDFHLGVGVERFFLYDNNSADDPMAVLAPYVEAGVVSVTPWPHDAAQRAAYDHALAACRDEVRWLAFIDIDEFLFSTVDQHLPNLLRPFADAPAVVANWVSFGSGGHVARPPGGVLESYTRRGDLDAVVPYAHLRLPSGEYRPINAHVKSIVDPRRTLSSLSPHHFQYVAGELAVDEAGRPVAGPWSDRVSVETLRVNHYWSKSQEECRAKFARGRATMPTKRGWQQFLMRDAVANDFDDFAVLDRLPAAKSLAA